MSIHLASVTASRDNNFNLLRFCAATGVFISHVHPLAGMGRLPATSVLGYVSVNVFFIISGFLVTRSLLHRKHLPSFAWARALRIFPALTIAVLFSALVIGVLFTSLPLQDYLFSTEILGYVTKNILLLLPDIPKTLPGVFTSSPWSSEVNAPLWTLPYEIKMYLLLGLLGVLLVYKPSPRKRQIFISILLLLTIISMALFTARYTLRKDPIALGIDYDYFRFLAMFGAGSLCYIFRNRLRLSFVYLALIIATVLAVSHYRPLFVGITYASLVYMVLFFAYVPGGFIRSFNRLGDYSYGIYIYGYPIQKSTEALFPNLPLATFFLVSFLFTLMMAMASWHLVEKKMLSYKNSVGRRQGSSS